MVGRSAALFVAAAIAEIGGAYLVWIGIKEHKARWPPRPARGRPR